MNKNNTLTYDAFLRTMKENTDVAHSLLLGAGASITSGVQSAADCIWEWKKNIFISKNPNLQNEYAAFKSESVQRSIQTWLDQQGIYPKENSPEEYSFYAEEAFPIDDTRRKYFENLIKGKEPYVGYKVLTHLAKRGLFRVAFSTNFDGLVEKAAHQTGLTPIPISLANPEYAHRPSTASELLVVALHGDFKFGPLKNTSSELDSQNATFKEALKKHLYNNHLIVLGFSGRDRSLMEALKEAYSEQGGGMLFWCGYGHTPATSVTALLDGLSASGRQGFYVPTGGFDAVMIDIAKICYLGDGEFQMELAKLLKVNSDSSVHRSPFKLDLNASHYLLRSNLFPITLPGESFQVKVNFPENQKVWANLRARTKGKDVTVVPLKGHLYGFGTMSAIRELFSDILDGDIRRTPVRYLEIRDGATLRSLYLSTIVTSLGKIAGMNNDSKGKLWFDSSTIETINGAKYPVHDAFEVSLFFDHKIFDPRKPFAYLSVIPTHYVDSTDKISRDTLNEIGRRHQSRILAGQPNVKFNDQIERFRSIFFPTAKNLQFEYPDESGSGFKFSIGRDSMYVDIMKVGGSRYQLRTPETFQSNKILNHGIQYLEPQLEFWNKSTGKVELDFHPMRGLSRFEPFDFPMNGNVFDPSINLAVICPAKFETQLFSFLNRLNSASPAGSNNPDYLLNFPGFHNAYSIPLNVPDPVSDNWKLIANPITSGTLMDVALGLADAIKRNIDLLESGRKKVVVVIFIPTSWLPYTKIVNGFEKFDLHDYIKAYAAQKQISTQFIQEETLADLQECQVSWWLSLALYVKSHRTPWVLQGLQSSAAFVGIGYSVKPTSAHKGIVMGCSHIYDSQGQGLKYRLSRIEDCTFDDQKNPHLSYSDAHRLGTNVRELFFNNLGELPKRVVFHKRTHYKVEEIQGIVDSLGKTGIKQIDMIEINFEYDARFIALFSTQNELKPNLYPISRGSCILLDDFTALLWTHGIVPSVKADSRSYFQGGRGMPVPLRVKKHYGMSNIHTIATEIMGLTKMDWNSLNLYSKLPATIQTSNEIARIGWLLNRFEGNTYDYRNFM